MSDRIAYSQLEMIAPDALQAFANNSRTHSDEQIGQIVSSIEEFGFTNPILIGDADNIIAGHGRVMAALRLGMEAVPCIRLTGLWLWAWKSCLARLC